MDRKREQAIYPTLLVSVFVIATCGILYELLLSSISSYFLGNSILQFSLTIGLFMFFMGIGSYISKYVRTNLFEIFVVVEIILGVLGGLSALALNTVFAYSYKYYYLYNLLFVGILGTLIGIEIPIVTRIIVKYSTLKETVAKVLSFDYIGALVASLLFPLLLLPKLGIISTSFLIGILNLFVSAYNAWFFRKIIAYSKAMSVISFVLIIFFVFGIFYVSKIEGRLEQKIYQDKIIFKKDTKYQHLVLTRWRNDYRLFINGSIQFSATDEYRYHESLVHIPMMLSVEREKILVLGGGDGMAVREVLKYADVKEIHLVDLDPEMTELGKNHKVFRKLNNNSLHDAKVSIFNEDAFSFISNSNEIYSTIIIDLPDPNNTGLGKLYSKEFYEILKKHLSKTGVMVTQSTSPYFAPKAYWCIYNTLAEVFDQPIAYNVPVPAFGIWGFVAAGGNIDYIYSADTTNNIDIITNKLIDNLNDLSFANELKLLDSSTIVSMFVFKKDMKRVSTEINNLNTQKLVEYYTKSAEKWR